MRNQLPQTNQQMERGGDRPHVFEFVLLNEVSMLSVTSAIEPLRVANRMARCERYAWTIVSENGAEVRASNGLKIASSGRIGEGPVPDYTFVCAGLSLEAQEPKRLSAFLNRRFAAGVTVGSISMGTIFLARAGLLTGRRCTIHWEGMPAFLEEFPDIDLTTAIYEMDNKVLSCSGGMSSFDLMMEIIAQDHSRSLVYSIANQLQMDRIRSGVKLQSTGSSVLPENAPKQLMLAHAIISENMESPLSPGELAEAVGASRRTLERMFVKYTKMTPSKFCKIQRLERSKSLLLHSNLQILEIAVVTGFRSASYFSSCFSDHFGITPSALRQGGGAEGRVDRDELDPDAPLVDK